ncbi:MAG TPA: WcaF family extracellular polysaccharide biosynthesis acetyltransferase [Bacteroidia bacterium]|nr:WcaF family extracellular polysaccharide biosynthesis acetyltransferase [Bacteroidia bacterium]
MNSSKTDLSKFNNAWYKPGKSAPIRMLWYVVNLIFFRSANPFYGLKRLLLRGFGAKIGKHVIIKPHVSIKFPWKLEIADHVWIGEGVWIDNLGQITIQANCCISQGAMLLCGNHNYRKNAFDLVVQDIFMEEGSWVGAKAVLCPGVRMGANSLLTVGSVAVKNLDPDWIYQGNPAQKLRKREFSD